MNAALTIKKLKEQVAELKTELRAARADDFNNVMHLALGEHIELAMSRNWRIRVGTYTKATDADLVKFHAILSQPKFAGPLYMLAMGVMHRLLDAETSHDVVNGCNDVENMNMCHGFED